MNHREDDRSNLRSGHGGDDWRSDSARGGWGRDGGEARFGGAHRRDGYGGSSGYGSGVGGAPLGHRGKGPKGFKRSDERINELVSEALSDHAEVDASEIEVSVKDGEVTLAGTVDDRRAKRLAEDIVDGVLGVVDVHNTIRVVQKNETTPAAPPKQNGDTAPSRAQH